MIKFFTYAELQECTEVCPTCPYYNDECPEDENGNLACKGGTFREIPDVLCKSHCTKISYIGPYPLVPAKEGDAGYDISSNENGKLYGSMSMGFSTGLYVAIPPGYVGKVVSRSGLAFKHNIEVGAGVIDSGYRGEVRILLHNFGDRPFEIKKGDRIAQLLILKHESPEFVLVDELDSTERGANGFGHTGVKETMHVPV